jgi:hypothetical protein
VIIVSLSQVQAGEFDYRTKVDSTRERFESLDLAFNDYRKNQRGLPPQEEEERLRLFGRLLNEDPVWGVALQLRADIDAITSISPQAPADRELLERLKDLLAITCEMDGRAHSRQEAETYAKSLRQFIARRDVDGARLWVKSR